MSVVPIDLNRRLVSRTDTRQGFWHSFAERLDALVAYASKQAVSERVLRRADAEIGRCRDLFAKKDLSRKDLSSKDLRRNVDRVRLEPVRVQVR
jgi:hypothetical protein